MITFEIPEEVRDIVEMLKEFCHNEVRDHYRTWEEQGELPDEFLKKYHELGMSGLKLPESLGGSELNTEAGAAITQALSHYGDIGVVYALPGPGFGGDFILECGSEDQIKKFLLPFLEPQNYKMSTALLLREETPDFYFDEMKTTARRDGDNYILNGKKTFILNGLTANLLVIVALDEAGEVAVFVTECSTEGVTKSERLSTLGLNTSNFCNIELKDVVVPAENRLENVTVEGLEKILNSIRLKTAAMCVGAMKAACDQAFSYANERTTFGKTLWQHQGMAFFLADMAAELEMADGILLKGAAEFRQNKPGQIAQALAQVEESALKVASDAVQALGGAGFMRDYPVEKWMRDIRTATVISEVNPHYDGQFIPDMKSHTEEPEATKDPVSA